jgi:hypothetical protein
MSETGKKQSFLGKLRGMFADHARENLCAALLDCGVEAQLSDGTGCEATAGAGRGRAVSRIPVAWAWIPSGDSIGVIDISPGPVRWVNVLRYHNDGTPVDHWNIYGIPDPKVCTLRGRVDLKCLAVRKLRLGLLDSEMVVVALKWKANDSGLGIAGRLERNAALNNALLNLRRQGVDSYFEIHSDADLGCWLLETKAEPFPELWNCYQAIARQLVGEP